MKNAKRSVIITAILAIIMCASLAAGATFALFSSSSSVNIAITSANVEVNADVKVTKTWHEDNNVEKAGLYDTGKAEVTYENNQAKLTLSNFVPTDGVKLAVSLKNESTVKIKYRVLLLADRTVGTELLDELDIVMNGMEFRGYTLATEYVELEAGASINDIPVTIVFPKEATEGKNTTCNLAIKVDAQQGNAVATNDVDVPDGCVLVKETKDGANWYSVISAAALNDGIEETVDFASTLVVSEGNMTINATNKTIENTNDLWDSKPNAWSLVSARETANVTVMGGNFKAKENDCYAVDVQDGANVVIKDGNFIGNVTAVYVYEGSLTIEGGFFDIQQLNTNGVQPAYGVLINCYDANRANGTANIIVKGGTFVNFNPADNKAEGEHTNFVAEGYQVVSETKEKEDGTTEVWYTVVLDEENYAMITVENAEGVEEQVLAKKVNNANFVESLKDGATVILTEDVTLPDGFTFNQKNVVIDGAGKYCLKTADGNYVIYGENMTIQNVTLG